MAKHVGIKDSGAYFVIDPVSRKVIVPHAHKSIGVVGDHKSEQITFECPQMVDNHDITECDHRYITWVNVCGEIGHDELDFAEVDNGAEGMIYLSWTIRNGLTAENGVVKFSVHFEDCSDGDNFNCPECGNPMQDNGKVNYRWSTATCKECEILDAVNAAVGVYELIYTDGDTLVFADYTPVRDETIVLETNGVVPSGNEVIDTNGHHDVATLASVDVAVPAERAPDIEVSESGLITASDGTTVNVKTHQLSASDDPEFVAENIRAGKTIFGVTGTWGVESTTVAIENVTNVGIAIVEYCYAKEGYLDWDRVFINPLSERTIHVARGSQLRIYTEGGYSAYPDVDGESVHTYLMNDSSGVKSYYMTMPTDKEAVWIQCNVR